MNPETRTMVAEYAIKELNGNRIRYDTNGQAFLLLVLDGLDIEASVEAIQEYSEHFARRMASRIGVILQVPFPNAHAFLFGGQLEIEPFIKAGYNDLATTYEENSAFWKKCCISKLEFNAISVLSI